VCCTHIFILRLLLYIIVFIIISIIMIITIVLSIVITYLPRFNYIMISLNGLSRDCVKWFFVFLFSIITRYSPGLPGHNGTDGISEPGLPGPQGPPGLPVSISHTIRTHSFACAIILDFNKVFRKRNSYNRLCARCLHSS